MAKPNLNGELASEAETQNTEGSIFRACNLKQNAINIILEFCESPEEGEMNSKWKDQEDDKVWRQWISES